jgi:hypothetical protein
MYWKHCIYIKKYVVYSEMNLFTKVFQKSRNAEILTAGTSHNNTKTYANMSM